MANDEPNPPYEEEDEPQLEGAGPPPMGEPEEDDSGFDQLAYPDAPVVEAADFLGLDAELSGMGHGSSEEPASPAQPAMPADSASSWLFQPSESPGGDPPGLSLEQPPQQAPQPAPHPGGGGQRPGASWLLDPERRAAASRQTDEEDDAWLMQQEEFSEPAPSVDPNVELPEGSYYEPEPAGRTMGRLLLKSLAAGLLITGGLGAWKAMMVPGGEDTDSGPLVFDRDPEVQPRRGSNVQLEPLENPRSRTAGGGAREPGELSPSQRIPGAGIRGGSREFRRPSPLGGTVRRDRQGPIAGSLGAPVYIFAPQEVREAQSILDNLKLLASGEEPSVASASQPNWSELIEATRNDPTAQGRHLGLVWGTALMQAQRALENGYPAAPQTVDPNAERLAWVDLEAATEEPVSEELPSWPDATPGLPSFDPSLLAALTRNDGLPMQGEPEVTLAFDPRSVVFPPSAIEDSMRIAAAQVIGASGAPVEVPLIASVEPSFGPVATDEGVQPMEQMGPVPTDEGSLASVEPSAPGVVSSPETWFPMGRTNKELASLTPSTLVYAQPSDLWLRSTIPHERVEEPTRLRTPRVGLVRVVSASGEVFQGRLYAVGQGDVWLDTSLGRMSLDHSELQRIERIEGYGIGELNGRPRTAGLDRVRVKVAGGYFVGYELSRRGKEVVILTDDGNKLTLRSDQVEPDTPRQRSILTRPSEDRASSGV